MNALVPSGRGSWLRACCLAMALAVAEKSSAIDPCEWVDPLIGCATGDIGESGGMMPMTGVPFGSVQFVPMTRLGEVGELSFHAGGDTNFLGFIATRQPAVCMGDWGHFSFHPRVGAVVCCAEERATPFDVTRLIAKPWLLEVVSGGVRTRMSATSHAALVEIDFCHGGTPHLVVDASRSYHGGWTNPEPLDGFVEMSEDGRFLYGWNSDRLDGHHSYPLPNFRGWFVMEFSRPFVGKGVYRGRTMHAGARSTRADCVGGWVEFAPADEPLVVRIGVSLIGLEEARANLLREIPEDTTVDGLATRVRAEWRSQLSRISIETPDPAVRRIFYTGLYHASLYPREISEGGRYYSAFDDNVHEGESYTCFSGWDIYRAEFPLLTLINPERVDSMMRALVQDYEEGGWLPKWPNPGYTSIMIGGPAEIMLAEAWAKGFRGFDLDKAYAAVRKNATCPQDHDREFAWRDRGCFGAFPETRGGLSWYQDLGYVACDRVYESVSRTLDFAFDDTAAAVLAEAAGHMEDAEFFRRRSHCWTNVWCEARKLCLPRDSVGRWCEPESGFGWHYTECSPETALWSVPHDVELLMKLVGGRRELVRMLDRYFDTVFFRRDVFGGGVGGRASVHGNEPSHHVAYLYNRAGRPDRCQECVRKILRQCYDDSVRGFDGNEDCGQMSAWYILSALGFYPLLPHSATYEIGSPLVHSAVLKLGDRELKIIVRNPSPNRVHVASVLMNGVPIGFSGLRHEDMLRGGELVFTMKE